MTEPNKNITPRKQTDPLKATIIVVLIMVLLAGSCVGCTFLLLGSGVEGLLKEIIEGHRVISDRNETIYNKDGLKITYKGLIDPGNDPQIKLLIENDSDSRKSISVDAFSIDDYTADVCFYEDIPAGKKCSSYIEVSMLSLIENSMTPDSIETAEFCFIITTNNDEKTTKTTEPIVLQLR